jgi:hypothetical protein
VDHLGESFRRPTADALRGAIGSYILRMLVFQLLQTAQKLVIVGIRDLRAIENVIEFLVPSNLFP